MDLPSFSASPMPRRGGDAARWVVVLATAATLFLLAVPGARAGNTEGIYFGEQAVLTGGAVRAIIDDGSATIYNPAGLGTIDTQILNVSLSAFQFQAQRIPGAYVLENGDSFSINGSQLTPLPTSIAFTRPLANDWIVGLGVFTRSFTNTSFSIDDTTQRGDARFDTDIELEVRENVFRAGAGLGKQLSPRVSFGFSLAAEVATRAAQSSISLDRTGISDPSTGSISRLEASKSSQTVLGLGAIVGTMVRLSERWTFGGVIELPTFRIYNGGRAASSTLMAESEGTGELPYRSSEDEQVSLAKPGLLLSFIRAHTSFAYESGRWTLTLEADVALENSFHIDSVLQGVWNARAGLQYTTPSKLTFGFGLFTDRAPNFQTFESTFGNYQFTGASAAVRFQNKHTLENDDGEIRSLVFSSTFGLRYAYGRASFEPISLSFSGDRFDVERGTKTAHELTLYIASTFAF